MKGSYIISIIILSCLGTSYAADFYKYTDEEGTVHYSNTPRKDAGVTSLQENETILTPKRRENTLDKDSDRSKNEAISEIHQTEINDLINLIYKKRQLIDDEMFAIRNSERDYLSISLSLITRGRTCYSVPGPTSYGSGSIMDSRGCGNLFCYPTTFNFQVTGPPESVCFPSDEYISNAAEEYGLLIDKTRSLEALTNELNEAEAKLFDPGLTKEDFLEIVRYVNAIK